MGGTEWQVPEEVCAYALKVWQDARKAREGKLKEGTAGSPGGMTEGLWKKPEVGWVKINADKL